MRTLALGELTEHIIGSSGNKWTFKPSTTQAHAGSYSSYIHEDSVSDGNGKAIMLVWEEMLTDDTMVLCWVRDVKDNGDVDWEEMTHKANIILRYVDDNNFYFLEINHYGANAKLEVKWGKCVGGVFSEVDVGDTFATVVDTWYQIKVRLYTVQSVVYCDVYYLDATFQSLFSASEDEPYELKEGYSGIGGGFTTAGTKLQGRNYMDDLEIHKISDYSC